MKHRSPFRTLGSAAAVLLLAAVVSYFKLTAAPPPHSMIAAQGEARREAGRDAARPAPSGEHRVAVVYDGDTVRTAEGFVLRYIGIDTPERGEPFYEEARGRNSDLVAGRTVRIEVCRDEPVDKYGRTLAWVFSDGLFVNGELLREGFGRALVIPPCGLEKVREIRALENEAKAAGRGIWKGRPGKGGQ